MTEALGPLQCQAGIIFNFCFFSGAFVQCARACVCGGEEGEARESNRESSCTPILQRSWVSCSPQVGESPGLVWGSVIKIP